MTKWFVYILLANVYLLLSCGDKSVREKFAEADRLVNENNLDSAVWLLEEQITLSALSDSDKAEYGRRLAWLHLLQDRSLVNDSLIDYSVDYYKEHASEPLLSAYFVKAIYMGDSRKGFEQRRALYREAIDSAYSRSDSTYLVRFYDRLTSLSFGEGLYRETIAESKEWEASPKAGFKEMAYYMAGLSYSRLRMRDSADYYLRLAADSALAKNIEWYAHHFARNYADFLYDFNPKASIRYLRLLKERYPEREILGSYVMPWINLGELDSARKYIEKNTLDLERSHSDDIASHALNYAYQFILGVKENKPVDISRLGQYCDSLYTVKSQTEKAERERLVDQNRLRRENLRLEMSRQRTFSILVIVSLLSILVAGGVSLYIRNRRNRLIDMEERLEALRQLLNESKQSVAEEEKPDSAFFRKVLLQQLGVIRLMATTPTQQNKELLQQMTRITNEDVPVDTLLVWDDLYPIIDAVYDNFHTHLVRLSDGRLLEKEIQLCCLLCAGFSTKEISVVTQQSVRTIYQRKTDIRHKLGMDEKEDIIGNISAQTANINFSL